MLRARQLVLVFAAVLLMSPLSTAQAQDEWVVYDGFDGPGDGRHIVFVSGDEEYRSEEALPQLAKILAQHHGFKATVLFAVDPETGEINPNQVDNIPGLHNLNTADLMVLFTRFRDLPDEQMRHIVDYVDSGRPIVAMRTATHAFNFENHTTYDHYSWRSEEEGWEGGFGRRILGETWYRHHGDHGEESTRGLINGIWEEQPILNGVQDIWVPTDVYGVRDIKGPDVKTLVYGQSVSGMQPSAEPNFDKSIIPVAWTRTYRGQNGQHGRVFTTTMGNAEDLLNEDFRRLLVNAAYWGMGMEDDIPEEADVDIVGEYEPTPFGFDDFQEGVYPSDHAM